ncbi:hypothetical protein [Sinorhizobium sp. PC2]|uniref:hypothetical protein n=1 Tax=Ensifer aridi TaxID=1708715 RepID=UPI000A913EDB
MTSLARAIWWPIVAAGGLRELDMRRAATLPQSDGIAEVSASEDATPQAMGKFSDQPDAVLPIAVAALSPAL